LDAQFNQEKFSKEGEEVMASRRIKADNRTPRPPVGGGKKPPTKKGAVDQAKSISVGFGRMPLPPQGSGSMTAVPYSSPKKSAVRKPAAKKPKKAGGVYGRGML
jgi:hypothetical protein